MANGIITQEIVYKKTLKHGKISISDLAEKLNCTDSQISKRARGLNKAGLIKISCDPSDKRVTMIEPIKKCPKHQ